MPTISCKNLCAGSVTFAHYDRKNRIHRLQTVILLLNEVTTRDQATVKPKPTELPCFPSSSHNRGSEVPEDSFQAYNAKPL